MLIAGVDGCRGDSWIAIEKELGRSDVHVRLFKSSGALFDREPLPDLIAIDIPIGLSDDGSRECDRLVRSMLGRRASSVFPAPIRAVLNETSYPRACELSFERSGKKISKQTWAIVPKILQIDTLIRNDRRLLDRVAEVHPELSFAEWNHGVPMTHPKSTLLGRNDRLRLIESHFGHGLFESLRAQVAVRDVADSDLLDAFAALFTADRIAKSTAQSLPSSPLVDRFGIPMKIAF